MDYLEEIFDKAKALMRGNTGVNGDLLNEMCSQADAEFKGRIKKHVDRVEIRELYVRACAMLAVSLYLQFDETGDYSFVRVGSVSLSRRGAGTLRSTIETLRRQAELLLAPCLEDSNFWFQSVDC